MGAIFIKELRCMLLSPLAWSLLAVLQLLLAWLFLVQLEQYLEIQPRIAVLENAPGVTQLVVIPLLDSAAVIAMLLIPLLSMGLLSREYQSGTIHLLLSAPVGAGQIILAKYLALLIVAAIMLILIAAMPLSLLLGTGLDLGTLLAGLLALALSLAAFAALGLCISGLTPQPAVAAIISYGALLLLWLINLAGSGGENSLLEMLSLSHHFRRMLTGLVTSEDIAYFVLLVLVCLSLAIHRLDGVRRWS
ncbi:MAG: ABC transporter permease subunit [Gammaproteobacteria bacterium]|nr:ABC transporter permease subunit [Gammaproteobacteria bacterium]